MTSVAPEPYLDVMDIVGNLPAPGRDSLIEDRSQLENLEARLRAVLG
ncbi:hypothetical protein [Microbacterium gorillae]|nr:hypothetical protein [Microbacterium gorillae]